MNHTKTSFSILIVSAVAFASLLLVGCQETSGGQPTEPVAETRQTPLPIFGRTLSSSKGTPLSGYLVAPQSIQDLINRYDVVFTGTIAAVGEPVDEKAYDWTPEDDARAQSRGIPPLRFRMIYYEIELGEVFLDDGNLRAYPRLRLSGDHSPIRPQVGERFLFALGANPDGKSYGVNADWNLIHLDGGPIRNFDGKGTGYAGVTNEASLKSAVQAAVPNRVHLPRDQWPVQSKWLADENAPAETPQPPGGDGPGDRGPVGNANQ